MVVLVTGSREIRPGSPAEAVVRRYIHDAIIGRMKMNGSLQHITLVHGACPRGADQIAEDYSSLVGRVKRFEAHWKRLGPVAGPQRNKRMVDFVEKAMKEGQDAICLAFPALDHKSRGTRGCLGMAMNAGIPFGGQGVMVHEP